MQTELYYASNRQICINNNTEKNENEKIVRAVIIKEVYLMKNFKINLLIDNDILDFKLIDILTSTNSTYKNSYKIIIFIFIRIKFKLRQISIHIIKIIIVFFELELFLNIHSISLSDRDYLFESINIVNFSIYAHVIDLCTKTILVQNKSVYSVKIFRNFRLHMFNEMNYSNVYLIDFDASNLAIKSSKKNTRIIDLRNFWSQLRCIQSQRVTILRLKMT